MKKILASVIMMFFLAVHMVFAQEEINQQPDSDAAVFMSHLRKNWDDIHDVIMRFHCDEPGLQGIVIIHMKWEKGSLESVSVDSSDIDNEDFGQALIGVMENWHITGLSDNWEINLPLRTIIQGSDHPEFSERGIFTGKVLDAYGNPVYGARLILIPTGSLIAKPDTIYTNREGVFIRTLVPAGKWKLECSKDGYPPTIIENLRFEKGQHIKRSIVLQRQNFSGKLGSKGPKVDSSGCLQPEAMITYIANEGFLLEVQEKKILVDALFGAIGGNWCDQPDDSLLKRMINGEPPFDGIDALMVTHYHADHFNAGMVSEFMRYNPRARLICPEQVAGKLADVSGYDDFSERIWVLPGGKSIDSMSIGEVKITALAFEHGPFFETDSTGSEVNLHRDVLNTGYIIDTGDNRIFHSGDASSSGINTFRKYAYYFRDIDVGLIDRTFLRPEGQEIINSIIKPQKLVLMHIMPSRKAFYIDLFRDQPDIKIFSISMESFEI